MKDKKQGSFDFESPLSREDLEPLVYAARVPRGERRSIDERFMEFHEANPSVCANLMRLALDLQRRGAKRQSVDYLFQVLRWHYYLSIQQPTDDDEFKLNNDFRSRYARLMMKKDPRLEGFFEVRKLTSRGGEQ